MLLECERSESDRREIRVGPKCAAGKCLKAPVFCGDNGRESALSYARQRAGYAATEIQVLDESGNVTERISNEDLWPLV